MSEPLRNPLDLLRSSLERQLHSRSLELAGAQRDPADPPESSLWDLAKEAPGRVVGAPLLVAAGKIPALTQPFGSPERVERAKEIVGEFEETGQEYLQGADSGFGAVGRAVAKTGLELGGFAAQGAVTAHPAAAMGRLLPGASVAAQTGKAALIGAIENAAWEHLEGGRPEIAAGIGGVMAGLAGYRGALALRRMGQLRAHQGLEEKAVECYLEAFGIFAHHGATRYVHAVREEFLRLVKRP